MSEVREVMSFLSGVPLPAGKEDLVEYAKKNGASEDELRALEKIPDQRFSDINDVWLAVGGVA
ncbi:MAG: DUF2795 domain-containing protein [Methanocella sp.]